MKVLLIDDAEAVRERLAGILAELPGIEVAARASGTEELRPLMHRERPDVVIVDVNMASGGGLDLIRAIREMDQSPIVIALSSISSLQYRRRCLDAGAVFFFDKVREQDMLIEAVTSLKEELG